MLRHLSKKFGFSLTEVIVATVIFALVSAGLLSVVSGLSRPAAQSSHALTATWVGKGILDQLRPAVDAESWSWTNSSNPLWPGGNYQQNPVQVGNFTYQPIYYVTNETGTGGRSVTINITWEE